jgi:hypothetical protein
MFCIVCNSHLSTCTCEDIDERLASLRNAPHFMYKMCRRCEKYYDRCKCPEPDWTTSHDGVELNDVLRRIVELSDVLK